MTVGLVTRVIEPGQELDAVTDALPPEDEWMSAAQIQDAETELQRIETDHPSLDEDVKEVRAEVQQRVEEQVRTQIQQGQLDGAVETLYAARDSWPDRELFGDSGVLRSDLDSELEARQILENISEHIANAQEALADDSIEGTRVALRELGQVLELDPDNEIAQTEIAQTLHDDIRRNLHEAIRSELDAGNPDRAQEFLDTAQNEWPGRDDFAQQRAELSELRKKIATAAEVQWLIDRGLGRLREGSLSTPPEESAVDYFRQALVLDPGNEAAIAGLAQVADRYVHSIESAVLRKNPEEARDLDVRLRDVAPHDPRLPTLLEKILELEREDEKPTVTPVVPVDDETRFWLANNDSCPGVKLYKEKYPDGWYEEDAERFQREHCRVIL